MTKINSWRHWLNQAVYRDVTAVGDQLMSLNAYLIVFFYEGENFVDLFFLNGFWSTFTQRKNY